MASVLFITAAAGVLFVMWLIWLGVPSALVAILTLLFLLPIHDTAEIIVCKGISIFIKPHHLPEMEFTDGIPDEYRTLIVYASLLTSKEATTRALECMEDTHLANVDDNLPIAILTHFRDSAQEDVTWEESELLNFTAAAIEFLNEKHSQGRFFLFHRDREWNTVSRKWIGWERKRGGVEKLNRWLLGKIEGEGYHEQGPGRTFSRITGDISALGQVSKVILLDSDNVLPNDYAKRLVAIASHPLNQPVISETDEIVVQGYGVLQPFPIPTEESCARSFYARMEGWHRRPGGPHHYILESLQNLFREGTYIGKGIYDVATHERVLANRFPDNQLLSHDKAESGFLRAALVPDVFVLEEALDNFLAGISQIERWLRGDKQALLWALPWIPDRKRGLVRNPLSLFSRWNLIWPIKKQLSNLFLIMFCVAGWFVPELPSGWCSLFLIGIIAFPYLVVPLSLRSPVSSITGIVRGLVSTVVYVSFSLHKALLILVAVVRVTFQFPERGYVSNVLRGVKELRGIKEANNIGVLRELVRNIRLLAGSMIRRPNIDWVTAGEVKGQREIYTLPGICMTMFPSLVICLAVAMGCFIFVEGLIYVIPVLGLWLVAPLIVYATSREQKRDR